MTKKELSEKLREFALHGRDISEAAKNDEWFCTPYELYSGIMKELAEYLKLPDLGLPPQR